MTKDQKDMEMRFEFLAKPDPRGHKFFKASGHWEETGTYAGETEVVPCKVPLAGIWLCDDSGRTPADSSDGPIQIVEDEPLLIYDQETRVGVDCTVWVARTESRGRVMLSPIEAEWVKGQIPGMKVKVSGSRHLDALARLIRSV